MHASGAQRCALLLSDKQNGAAAWNDICSKLGTPKEVTARLMKRTKDANGRDNSTALVIQLQWIVKPASP
jgi:hypothetical protein